MADPYPMLAALRRASPAVSLLLTYDHVVGFAHLNIGSVAPPRAGPRDRRANDWIARAVENRVLDLLRMPPPKTRREYDQRLGGVWDQNAFNKQVLDSLSWDERVQRSGYKSYMEAARRMFKEKISMDDAWLSSLGWEKTLVPAPAPLGAFSPWYPPSAPLYWRRLLAKGPPIPTSASRPRRSGLSRWRMGWASGGATFSMASRRRRPPSSTLPASRRPRALARGHCASLAHGTRRRLTRCSRTF